MENNQELEIRKLPKKTIITIAIMVILIGGAYIFLKGMKEDKLVEILNSLGHKKVSELQVINKLEVEDKETRYKSKVYKVKFFDNELNKTCIGFVHFGKNNTYNEDIDCK